jgi:hypothetical protein
MTLSIMLLSVTVKNVLLIIVIKSVSAECHYAKCRGANEQKEYTSL